MIVNTMKKAHNTTAVMIIIRFLLDSVMPHTMKDYRYFLHSMDKNISIHEFNMQNRIFIRGHYKPRDRVAIYNKLDSLPVAMGYDEPEGRLIATRFDNYVGRNYYTRGLNNAVATQRRYKAKWESFVRDNNVNYLLDNLDGTGTPEIKQAETKMDFKPGESLKEYITVPADTSDLDITFLKDGRPRKSYTQAYCYDFEVAEGVKVPRMKWTNQMKAYFIHCRVIENLSERVIGDLMGLTKGQMGGIIGQYHKGSLRAIQDTVLGSIARVSVDSLVVADDFELLFNVVKKISYKNKQDLESRVQAEHKALALKLGDGYIVSVERLPES